MNSFAAAFGVEVRVDTGTVDRARQFLTEHAAGIEQLVNAARRRYRNLFHTEVGLVSTDDVRAAIDDLMNDFPRAINLSCLLATAFSLRGTEDYEVFVIDELLGSAIAEVVAGPEPNRTFARANFHVFDVTMKDAITEAFGPCDDRQLAVDDALAGLGAGFEAILPGWDWMDTRRKQAAL